MGNDPRARGILVFPLNDHSWETIFGVVLDIFPKRFDQKPVERRRFLREA